LGSALAAAPTARTLASAASASSMARRWAANCSYWPSAWASARRLETWPASSYTSRSLNFGKAPASRPSSSGRPPCGGVPGLPRSPATSSRFDW